MTEAEGTTTQPPCRLHRLGIAAMTRLAQLENLP
jgi:hypothetical protein